MSFGTGYQDDPSGSGSGELGGGAHFITNHSVFEDSLVVGRYVKLDAGSLDLLDGSATPTVWGAVHRNVAGVLEDGSLVRTANVQQVDAVRQGLVTVDVVSGVTPTPGEQVLVINATGADAGKAHNTAAAGRVAIQAEFVREIAPDVWEVNNNLGVF